MSVDTTAGPIPNRYVKFCKVVASLAREAGFDSIALTIRPGFYEKGPDWSDPITLNWTQGRHGDDSRNMAITSTVVIRAELESHALSKEQIK